MIITKISQQQYNQNIVLDSGFANSVLAKTHSSNRKYYKISEDIDLGYLEITNSKLTIKQLYVLVEHRNKSLRIIKEVIKFMFDNNPKFYIVCIPKIQTFLLYCNVEIRLIGIIDIPDSPDNLVNLEISNTSK